MLDFDDSIIDSTKPNAGRIYDYILGGDYNFPIDRQIVDDIIVKIPTLIKTTKLIRWFLGNAIDRAFKMGFTQFLDFASGLPTVDHIHTRIPEDVKKKVKILYSDIDPVTVQIGKEIIRDEIKEQYPVIKFEACDCRKPETLLNSDVVKNLFDKNQKIVIGLNGILYFLTSEQISYTTKVLYDWAPKGSIIYLSMGDTEKVETNKGLQQVYEYYKNINQPFYTLSQKELIKCISPWSIKEPGFQLLEEWLELEEFDINISDELKELSGGYMYGGFLEK